MADGNIKYFICYDTPVGVVKGKVHRRKGRQEISGRQYDRDFALGVASHLVEIYGEGTHWIEDETGEKVEQCQSA